MAKLILSLLFFLIPVHDNYAEELNDLLRWFPDDTYASFCYCNFDYLDEINSFVVETYLFNHREKAVRNTPTTLLADARCVIIASHGHSGNYGTIIKLKDSFKTISRAVRKHVLEKDADSLPGKMIYKYRYWDSWNESKTMNLIIWDAETIIGATNLDFLERMMETRESGSSAFFEGAYYQDFIQMIPDLGGYILASFNDENLLDLFEKDYEAGKLPKERLEHLKTHIPLSPTCLINYVRIEADKYIEEGIAFYKNEDAAQKNFDKLNSNPRRKYSLKGRMIINRESLTKDEIDKRDKLRKQRKLKVQNKETDK